MRPLNWGRAATLALWFTLTLTAAHALPQELPGDDARRVDGLSSATPGDALPPGWEVRAVRGVDPPKSEVVGVSPDAPFGRPGERTRALRVEGRGEAGFFWRELEEALDPAAHALQWWWRVDEPVAGAALTDPALDDTPGRFFVVFGRGGLFSSRRILFYSWGGADRLGSHWTYRDDDNVRVMVLRNATSPERTWLLEERDLEADYRATFGDDPGSVTAVGFMLDTDQMVVDAVGLLGPISFIPHPARGT